MIFLRLSLLCSALVAPDSLRHFFVPSKKFHTSTWEIGKKTSCCGYMTGMNNKNSKTNSSFIRNGM